MDAVIERPSRVASITNGINHFVYRWNAVTNRSSSRQRQFMSRLSQLFAIEVLHAYSQSPSSIAAGATIPSVAWLDGIVRRAEFVLRVPLPTRAGVSYTPLIDWLIAIITSVPTPNDNALLLMALITEHVVQTIITHGVAMAFNQPHDYIK